MRSSLREIAGLFLRLGATAFGGPAAHIGIMEHEVVRRRGWLTHQELLDLLAVTNLIPGPNSTEMAIHIGHRRGGWPGLVVAGTCFVVPAFLIVLGLAWLYVRYSHVPAAEHVLRGVMPVVIAIIAQALWRLGRSAVKTPLLGVLGLAAAAANVLGAHELIVLGAAGVVMGIAGVAQRWKSRVLPLLGFTPIWSAWMKGSSTAGKLTLAAGALPSVMIDSSATPGVWPLFLFFLKVGAVLYGSGYVLLAFLRADLVERWKWLTETQLLDAVAIGQVTPGPLFTTATFIGYLLGGVSGAVLSTLAIFLPAFVFVAISAPFVPRLRRSAVAASLLDGLNVGSLALMGVVTWYLGRTALVDVKSILIALAALLLLLRFQINSTWLVAAGAAAGWVLYR
jgi:chromate transporter